MAGCTASLRLGVPGVALQGEKACVGTILRANEVCRESNHAAMWSSRTVTLWRTIWMVQRLGHGIRPHIPQVCRSSYASETLGAAEEAFDIGQPVRGFVAVAPGLPVDRPCCGHQHQQRAAHVSY